MKAKDIGSMPLQFDKIQVDILESDNTYTHIGFMDSKSLAKKYGGYTISTLYKPKVKAYYVCVIKK